jgi:putative dehydrogenase
MADVIPVIAAGEMGAGIGRRLSERGARVLTSLKGRGAGSAARAKQANMVAVEDDNELVAGADIILSVVPPGQAVALAERLKPALIAAAKKPIYIDCNAVAPKTAERIGAVLAGTGCRYVDGGIVGAPPAANTSPRIYVSGEAAHEAQRLTDYGLAIRVLDGPIGAASALKMSYAGITKGLTAIGAAMMLGASRAGCAPALRQELAESQPQLTAWLTRQVPRMYSKAYRWVAEMEEIAAFLDEDPASSTMYSGMARLYERLAAGEAKTSRSAARELEALTDFCAESQEPRSKAS